MEHRPTELLKAPTSVLSGISGVDRPTPMLGARGPSLMQLTWKYTCLPKTYSRKSTLRAGWEEGDAGWETMITTTAGQKGTHANMYFFGAAKPYH